MTAKFSKKGAVTSFVDPESFCDLGKGRKEDRRIRKIIKLGKLTRFNYILTKLGNFSDETCRYCREENESAKHLLGMCPVLMQAKKNLGGFLIPENLLKSNKVKYVVHNRPRVAVQHKQLLTNKVNEAIVRLTSGNTQ